MKTEKNLILQNYELEPSKTEELSIGLEHEFFILKNNKNCNLLESQNFLEALSKEPGWTITKTHNGKILQVGKDCELNVGRYTAVKYEYPPHLLEVAMAPSRSIDELKTKIDSIFSDLESVSLDTGIEIRNTHYLQGEIEYNEDLLDCLKSNQLVLSKKRKAIALEKNISDLEIFEFPARVASTQIHIGGQSILLHKNFLQNLYSFEPFVYELSCKKVDIKDHLRERWLGYKSLYEGKVPLGFPYNFFNTFEEYFQQAQMQDLEKNNVTSYTSNDQRSYLVHDLQFIKPKSFGSLEFRSSPAQKNKQEIYNLCLLRAGQYLLAQEFFFKNHKTLKDSEKSWKDYIYTNKTQKLSDPIREILLESVNRRMGGS